jgi:hypothetical protein
MNRVAFVTVAAGLALARPAHGQTPPSEQDITIEVPAAPPSAPPPQPSAPSEQDITIEITAPPPGASAPPPAQPAPAVTPTPTEPVQQPRPSDSAEAIAASWNRRFLAGLSVGVGSPLGAAGAWVGVNASRAVDFTAGVGLGGTFGPALALGFDWRPFFFGRWALYGGAGISVNFTPSSYRGDRFLAAPSNSWWMNLELGGEYRAASGVALRLGLGHAIMLNTGEFTNLEFMGQYGRLTGPDAGYDPVSAADAHDEGRAFSMFFVHADLAIAFDL